MTLKKNTIGGAAHDGLDQLRVQPLRDTDLAAFGLRQWNSIKVNGEQTTLTVLTPDAVFKWPAKLDQKTIAAFKTALEFISDSVSIVHRISERQVDPFDGLVTAGARVLIDNVPWQTDVEFKPIAQYLFNLLKQGGTFDPDAGIVNIPPINLGEFESLISRHHDQSANDFDLKAWLNCIFDPVPRVTQGFYLFNGEEDWQRFNSSLGREYSRNIKDLKMSFLKISGSLSSGRDADPGELVRYKRLSADILEAQSARFNQALAQTLNDPAIRVRLRINSAGKISATHKHYLDEFKTELTEIGENLRRAAGALPGQADKLKRALMQQASWCQSDDRSAYWIKTQQEWIKLNDHKSLFDFNLTAEESASLLGRKSMFSAVLGSHVQVTPALKTVWKGVVEAGKQLGVENLMLSAECVAGLAAFYPLGGQKLPNSGGESDYKSVTYSNVSYLGLAARFNQMAAVLDLKGETPTAWSDIATSVVALHEFGHTKGSHSSDIAHAVVLEETQAEASAAYLAAVYDRANAFKVVSFLSCWQPVRYSAHGPVNPHARSDLAMAGEYLNAGAIQLIKKGAALRVELTDLAKAVQVAYLAAIKMRMWEQGIPNRFQSQIINKTNYDYGSKYNKTNFSLNDVFTGGNSVYQNYSALMRANISSFAARCAVGKDSRLNQLIEKMVRDEVRDYFSQARLENIAKTLKPALVSLGTPPMLCLNRNDRHFRLMLEHI